MNLKTMLIAMGMAATVSVSAAIAESQTPETAAAPVVAASENSQKKQTADDIRRAQGA